MGFAARLSEARSAQATQKGPITMDQTTKMIHDAISKAVKTNKLEAICTAQEVTDTAKLLGKKWDMNSFCEKYAMPPLLAADLLQLSLFDLIVFVDDSGSMNEGTKWADCAAIVTQIVELTTLFDTDGIQVEFMNNDVSQHGVASAEMCQSLFDSIRPAGYTPLSYSCERKIIDPFFLKCSKCSKADVKPIIVYIITDGAPTTDRGLATSVPTFAMLKRIDESLTRLGLPRKTVGINVTQIGFDEGATQFLQQLDDHPLFGDRVDCVSDYEQEMVQCEKQGVYLTPDMYVVKLLVGAVDATYDCKDDDGSAQPQAKGGGNAPRLMQGTVKPGSLSRGGSADAHHVHEFSDNSDEEEEPLTAEQQLRRRLGQLGN